MKFKKSSMNMAWMAAIVVCVAISIFAVLFTSCTKYSGPDDLSVKNEDKVNKDDEPASPVDEPGEEPGTDLTQPMIPVAQPGDDPAEPSEPSEPQQPEFNGVVLTQTEDAGREYLDKFVFLGDSTTYGIGYYYNQGYTELCPPSQVWTPSSGTLALFNYSIATVVYPETGAEIPIAEAVAAGKPEYMLLTIGVNGVSIMDQEWFIRDYKALIELIRQASPDTKLILNSIYPVANSYPHIADISNEKIRAANDWIKTIAEESGCRYLNTYEVLVGPDGALPESSHNGDGIHLSGESFEIVMDYIRTHAYQ